MRSVIGALVLFLIGCPQLVAADEASSRAVAEELLEVMDVEKHMSGTIAMIGQMQTAQLEQMAPGQPSSQAGRHFDAVRGEMMSIVAEELSWDKLKDEYVTAYVETYTEAELRGIVEFYRSPVGQKFIEKTPELTRRLMEIGQKRVQELTPEFRKMSEEMVEEMVERMKEEATPPSEGSSER